MLEPVCCRGARSPERHPGPVLLRFFCGLLALWIAVQLSALPAHGEDWHDLTQPIGNLVTVQGAAAVNALLGGNPPFDTRTDVTTINTAVPQYFVRFYNPTDGTNPSNAVGSWVMRAAAVRGLTPAQVRDIFALPSMPTHMTMVLVPAGYNLYTGIAGPIAGWGEGGAQQSKLIGPPWVPASNYFNQQPVMAFILSYGLLAPQHSNTGNIAKYLDRRIPSAYSDFEYVYLNLDMLYTEATASRFRDALDQIGPARYDHLTANYLHAAVLLNGAVDRRTDSLFTAGKGGSGEPVVVASLSSLPMMAESGEGSSRMWVQGIGGSQRAGDLGFNSFSGGLAGGTETRISKQCLAGFSMGFLHSRLDWTANGGDADTDFVRLGAYMAWMPEDFLVQAGLNGGMARSDVSRRIEFSGIDRSGSSRSDAWEINPRVRVGYRLPLSSLDVVPTAGVDFFYQDREGFTENGADSLNLRVASVRSGTLRTHLGVGLSKEMILSEFIIKPLLQAGWGREQYLDDHVIKAALNDQPDQFTVHGDSRTADILTTGLGILLQSGRSFSFYAQYGMEYREDRRDQTLSAGLEYRF